MPRDPEGPGDMGHLKSTARRGGEDQRRRRARPRRRERQQRHRERAAQPLPPV